jgi:hypothetical protein
VELGDVWSNADSLCSLFAADRARLGDDEAVQRPTCGIAERADTGNLGVELNLYKRK